MQWSVRPTRKVLALGGSGLVCALLGLLAWRAEFPGGGPARAVKTVGVEMAPAPVVAPMIVNSAEEASGTPGGLGLNRSDDRALEALWSARKLIRTGQVTLEVASFQDGYTGLARLVAARGGYIADFKADRRQQGRASGTITVRLQPTGFFDLMADLRGLGRVEEEAVSTQDVTRAYTDLEARLRAKREAEVRMRELLRTRTGDVDQVMEAMQRIQAVAEEIESWRRSAATGTRWWPCPT